MTELIRVFVVEDHDVVRRGIHATIHEASDMVVVGQADEEAAAIELIRERRPDVVLLDNMDTATLRSAVQMVGGRTITEASGGINLETAAAIAATGVDLLSVGALTHSAPTLDVALDMVE